MLRQELQQLWGLDEAEWNKMATSCGINPDLTQLNEFEFNRLDKAQQLLNEQRVNSHEEIRTFFANNAANYPLTDTMGNGSSTSPAPEEGVKPRYAQNGTFVLRNIKPHVYTSLFHVYTREKLKAKK